MKTEERSSPPQPPAKIFLRSDGSHETHETSDSGVERFLDLYLDDNTLDKYFFREQFKGLFPQDKIQEVLIMLQSVAVDFLFDKLLIPQLAELARMIIGFKESYQGDDYNSFYGRRDFRALQSELINRGQTIVRSRILNFGAITFIGNYCVPPKYFRHIKCNYSSNKPLSRKTVVTTNFDQVKIRNEYMVDYPRERQMLFGEVWENKNDNRQINSCLQTVLDIISTIYNDEYYNFGRVPYSSKLVKKLINLNLKLLTFYIEGGVNNEIGYLIENLQDELVLIVRCAYSMRMIKKERDESGGLSYHLRGLYFPAEYINYLEKAGRIYEEPHLFWRVLDRWWPVERRFWGKGMMIE